jgi:hypothetical protein
MARGGFSSRILVDLFYAQCLHRNAVDDHEFITTVILLSFFWATLILLILS